MDTKSRVVIYQHLFTRFCIFYKDTIGYKKIQLIQKASNTNNLRGART